MDVPIPRHLVEFARSKGAEGVAWLGRLPALIASFAELWGVELDAPLGDPPGAAGWLAPGRLADGTPVFLKLAWPHEEARTEAAGLRWFEGRGAVPLLDADESEFALLLERVEPGEDLWSVGVDEGAEIAADVLGRLWRPPAGDLGGIGELASTVAGWIERPAPAYPAELVRRAGERARELLSSLPAPVVLHGDFHPFNILRSADRGWVAIDPKPLVGDPAYDLAQYLHNRADGARATGDARAELRRQVVDLSDRLALDPRRVAGWASVKAIGWDFGIEDAVLLAEVDAALA